MEIMLWMVIKLPFVQKDTNLGQFKFQITEGKVNVNGYKFTRNYTSDFHLLNLVDFELRQSEPNTFTSDGFYQTFHNPVRKVFRIYGEKNASFTMTHGTSGSSDTIPVQYQPALRINSINVGGTFYNEGTDFVLDGDKINWGPAGAEPAAATTYTVDLDYGYTEVDPNFSGTNGDISPDMKSIKLEGFIPGSPVLLDYDFVLDRIDNIMVDTSGTFKYAQGVAKRR